MKKIFLTSFWFLLILNVCSGQESVEFFGYLESQILAAEQKADLFHLQSNKLRLDLQSSLNSNVTVAANFNYITYHGKKEWSVLDFLADDIVSTLPGFLRPLYVIRFSDESFLDNAYLKIAFPALDLTIGKQQISTGTGYAWNPTDVFNTKDLFDPTYEQPGHNGLRLDIPLSYDHTLFALYGVGDNWRKSDKMLGLKSRISGFDLELLFIELQWTFNDYTQFDFSRADFVGIAEKRRLWGFSTSGEVAGIGVWAELAHNQMSESRDFQEYVVGFNYTFDFQTYCMVELYRNTLGKTSISAYTLNDWMRLYTAEQKAISRDQLYLYIQHPLTDLMEGGLTGIVSISDNSFALAPSLNYSLFENVDLLAYLSFNFGSSGAVYGEEQGNGALLRARVYF